MYTDGVSMDVSNNIGMYSNNGAVKKNEIPKIVPTDELMDELWAVAQERNGRVYRRMMKQLDWTVASEEQLRKAIGITLGYVDLRQADYLSQIAIERFPDSQSFASVRKLFEKQPTLKPTKRRGPRSTPGAFKASMEWISEHNDDYEIGHWLAVNNGTLIADASTLDELDEIVDALLGKELLASDTLVYKVIS
ncbi:MAG: hypothetical protein AAF639_24835 [Chloroflexota bacterium]